MNSTSPKNVSSVSQALGPAGAGGLLRSGSFRWGLAALVVAGLGWHFLAGDDPSTTPRYETTAVERADLTVMVSATGNLQPTNQVDVGSELSGIVQHVFVDDNSRVKRGQELARLDVAKLGDQVSRSRAALTAAEAAVRQADATLLEARASLGRMQEVSRLSGGKVPAKTEMEVAEARLARAEADLASARAGVAQARATLSTDETNLAKASIRSPIDGVVLARKVEPGQTVAASLQAPVLFQLAEDLKQMELQVKVDEADVGQVREGQSAVFSVDAHPGRKYPARISRVSYGSQTSEGVVSYSTVLKVNNDDLSLRPGMTATAEITTARRKDALLVPNAALRFTPAAKNGRKDDSGGILGALLPRPPRSSSNRAPKDGNGKDGSKRIWVLAEGQPRAIWIRTGLSNGRLTEVLSGDLKPGMPLITDTLGQAK